MMPANSSGSRARKKQWYTRATRCKFGAICGECGKSGKGGREREREGAREREHGHAHWRGGMAAATIDENSNKTTNLDQDDLEPGQYRHEQGYVYDPWD